MLSHNNEEALSLLYKLYSPLKEGLKLIGDKFKIYLMEQGRALVNSVETKKEGKELSLKQVVQNTQLTEKLLSLLSHFRKVNQECF